MGGAGAADRGVPPAAQDGASRPAPHHRGDHLARRSSGGTIAARSGARSRLRWAPGGWQRRPSAAGRGWARGSDCWSWRSSVAGLRPEWLSSTAPASGRTTRPQARRKRGNLSRARRARGARSVARWLCEQGVRDRRCLRSRPRLRPGPRAGARAAAGAAAPDPPLLHPRLDRGRSRLCQPRLP